MKEVFYWTLFYSFKFFIVITPTRVMDCIVKGLAAFMYAIDAKHRKIASVNLELAYKDAISNEKKEKIIKATYVNLIYLLIDFIQNQGISKEVLLDKVTFHNSDILMSAMNSDSKIILMTAHYGNWELLPLAIAAKFGPLTGVGRKLDSAVMDKILSKNRQQFNIEMLDKKGAMREMISVLKDNRMLGLLVDQNTSENEGILIDFFGNPARHTPSAAILARRFDALIIPAFITTEDHRHYEITFYEPILTNKSEDKERDILESVQKQANITEEIIRHKPEAWFWLHKRWKNQFEWRYDSE